MEIPPKVLDPVSTKSLAKVRGLEEILKKIEGIGATELRVLEQAARKNSRSVARVGPALL